MSEPKKKLFGPLLYAALVAWALVAIFAGLEVGVPKLQEWLSQYQLVQNLRSGDPATRLAVLEHPERHDLGSIRSYVIETLQDPDVKVRVAACHVLSSQDLEQGQLIPVLEAAAGNENREIRLEVASCLGRICVRSAHVDKAKDGDSPGKESEPRQASLTLLYRLLRDESSDVRAGAARAVGLAGPAASSSLALQALADDPDRSVRLAVADALLQVDGRANRTAGDILCKLVADPGPVADRMQVLAILQKASDATQERAMGALADLLAHADPIVLPDIIACLGSSGPRARSTLPALEKLLDDRDPSTRAAAVMAILTRNEESTRTALGLTGMPPSAMAGGPKPSARVLAVLVEMVSEVELTQDWRNQALSRIRELNPTLFSKVTPGLIRQLGHSSADVRRTALDLLQQIIEDTPAEMPGPAARK